MKQNEKTRNIMEKKNEMKYGNMVDLYPLLYTNANIFIPRSFVWEAEAAKAIVTIYEEEIICNLGSKLLIDTDEGIQELSIAFQRNEKASIAAICSGFLGIRGFDTRKGPEPIVTEGVSHRRLLLRKCSTARMRSLIIS